MGYPENSSRLKTERRNAWISRREGGKRAFLPNWTHPSSQKLEALWIMSSRNCFGFEITAFVAGHPNLSNCRQQIVPWYPKAGVQFVIRENFMHSRESGRWERRREGNDVQISDFMHSREMGSGVGERGNDVQVGAALIPFLVNTSLLILADRRSNHKWEKQLRETHLRHLPQNPITDSRCLTKEGLIKIEARLKPNFVLLTTVRPPSNPIPSD